MKNLSKLVFALVFASVLTGAQAEEQKKKESAYLGVVTSPVNAVLTHQLGLSEGTGLVVDYIAPESAAAGTLEQHDILTRFEDQILISQHQLAVLVRSKQPGDEVKLSVFRKGKEETVQVALQGKELPPINAVDWGNVELQIHPFGDIDLQGAASIQELREAIEKARGAEGMTEKIREQVEQMQKQIQQQHGKGRGKHFFFGVPGGGAGGGGHAEIEIQPGGASSSVSTSIMIDGDRTITITDKNGDRHLTVKNNDGEVVFDGPVNTDEERAQVPEDVKPMLDGFKIERMELKKKAL